MRNLAHDGACPECTSNCLLVHRNRMDPSSSVDRFFKLMLGKDFSEVMVVPSNVAREKKWHKYINREACLEDTIGEKYPVKISEVENDVAFKEGWCRFSSEHHLEEGDSVVFNHFRHVKKLHFIVHIYGKSGEEKVFFPRGNDKNVGALNRDATLLNVTLNAGVMSADRKKGPSSSVVPKPLCSDIHHHVTTTNNIHGEYTDGKTLRFDHTAAAEISIINDEAGTMNHAENIIKTQREPDLLGTLPAKRRLSSPDPQPSKKQNAVTENTIDTVQRTVAPERKMDVNDGKRSSTRVPEVIVCQDRFGSDNTPVQRDVSLLKTASYNATLDNRKSIDRFGLASSAQDIRQKVDTGGDTVETVKKEVDRDELSNNRQFQSTVKKQTASPKNVSSSSSNVKKEAKMPKTRSRESSSAVVDDKPYLLLQSALPSVLLHGEKLQPIYLRAPDRKMLPVLYQQKNGVRVLTSGWQVFKSMYDLQAGYKCCIELEDASKRIYLFKVITN